MRGSPRKPAPSKDLTYAPPAFGGTTLNYRDSKTQHSMSPRHPLMWHLNRVRSQEGLCPIVMSLQPASVLPVLISTVASLRSWWRTGLAIAAKRSILSGQQGTSAYPLRLLGSARFGANPSYQRLCESPLKPYRGQVS